MHPFFQRAPAVTCRPSPSGQRAFTLVELLVAMTILLIMVLLMVGLTSQTNKIWRSSRARISAFQAGRNAFERMTTNLSQATLNTYLDYYDDKTPPNSRSDLLRQAGNTDAGFSNATNIFKPTIYGRAADLQFICGQTSKGTNSLLPLTSSTNPRPTHAIFFQCPLGHVDDPSGGAITPTGFRNLTGVLNAVGYYIEFSNENDAKYGKVPQFLATPPPPASWRYRLMELNQPSQKLDLYAPSVSYTNPGSWFSLAVDPVSNTSPAPVFVVADNIIALIVRPKLGNRAPDGTLPLELAPNYAYDTKAYRQSGGGNPAKLSMNQLPPLVQITMVAVDADSATRLATRLDAKPPLLVDSPTRFTDVTLYDADLAALETTLKSFQLNYRVFVTDVSIPGAKWSQTN